MAETRRPRLPVAKVIRRLRTDIGANALALGLALALSFFAANPAAAQEDSDAPGTFDECQTEQFDQLGEEDQQEVTDEPSAVGRADALQDLAEEQNLECEDASDNSGDTRGTTGGITSEPDSGGWQDTADQQDESSDEDDGGGILGGIGSGILEDIINYISESVGQAAAEEATQFLTGAAFNLPQPEGEINNMYEQVSTIMKPGAVVLLLMTGLLMTLKGANYNTAYATHSALPKIVVFVAGLAFFPEIMNLLSTWSQSFADALIGTSELDGAFERIVRNNVTPGSNLFAGIITFVTFFLLIGLVLVCALKSFLFGILYIVGPLAMFLYPIKNLSGITGAWFKGVLACFVIPILWVVEIRIGTTFIETPELLLGNVPGLGLYSGILLVVLTYTMFKTPFVVVQYCIYGQTSGNGIVGHLARAALVSKLIYGR